MKIGWYAVVAFLFSMTAVFVIRVSGNPVFEAEDQWSQSQELLVSVKQHTFHFSRDNGSKTWSGRDDRGLLASPELLGAVQDLFTKSRASTIVPFETLEEFEVQKSGRELEFRTQGETLDRWKVGLYNPALKGFYVYRSSSNQLELRKDRLFSLLENDPTKLTRSLVLSHTPEKISRLVLTDHRRDLTLSFQRMPTGWTVNGKKADTPFVDGLVSEVAQIELLSKDPSERADLLRDPDLSFFVSGKDNTGQDSQGFVSLRKVIPDDRNSIVFGVGSDFPGVWEIKPSSLFEQVFAEEVYLPTSQDRFVHSEDAQAHNPPVVSTEAQ